VPPCGTPPCAHGGAVPLSTIPFRTSSKQIEVDCCPPRSSAQSVSPHPASAAPRPSFSTAKQLPSARAKTLHCSKFIFAGPLPTQLVNYTLPQGPPRRRTPTIFAPFACRGRAASASSTSTSACCHSAPSSQPLTLCPLALHSPLSTLHHPPPPTSSYRT